MSFAPPAASDLPELRKIVLEHALGGIFDPQDPHDVARVLHELIGDEPRLEQK